MASFGPFQPRLIRKVTSTLQSIASRRIAYSAVLLLTYKNILHYELTIANRTASNTHSKSATSQENLGKQNTVCMKHL
jgi:hypothetical protein